MYFVIFINTFSNQNLVGKYNDNSDNNDSKIIIFVLLYYYSYLYKWVFNPKYTRKAIFLGKCNNSDNNDSEIIIFILLYYYSYFYK